MNVEIEKLKLRIKQLETELARQRDLSGEADDLPDPEIIVEVNPKTGEVFRD